MAWDSHQCAMIRSSPYSNIVLVQWLAINDHFTFILNWHKWSQKCCVTAGSLLHQHAVLPQLTHLKMYFTFNLTFSQWKLLTFSRSLVTCKNVNDLCLCLSWQSCALQMMTQQITGSPRKRDCDDLHLQSCGALSYSPSSSMCRPKHHQQTTSSSIKLVESPSSEHSLDCRETILWLRLSSNTGQNIVHF